MFRPESYEPQEATEMLSINLTPREIDMLRFIQQQTGIAPKQLMEDFIGDLCCSWRNGGSDERAFAFEWFKRRGYAEYLESTEAIKWRSSIEDSI
jgi:hypothetical protein